MTMVLDYGSVEIIDALGDDYTPAMRARRVEEPRDWTLDGRLTRYMAQHDHTSPFEFVEVVWKVKCPIFVARQWLRHRTANVNEFSMRYDMPEEVEYYHPETWRSQSSTNRQGSGEPLGGGEVWFSDDAYDEGMEAAIAAYYELLERGVAREQARIVLPVSVYTEFVWKNDLHNTLHFLKLRTSEDAQWEIRQYANAMVELLKERFPLLMEAVWEG